MISSRFLACGKDATNWRVKGQDVMLGGEPPVAIYVRVDTAENAAASCLEKLQLLNKPRNSDLALSLLWLHGWLVINVV